MLVNRKHVTAQNTLSSSTLNIVRSEVKYPRDAQLQTTGSYISFDTKTFVKNMRKSPSGGQGSLDGGQLIS